MHPLLLRLNSLDPLSPEERDALVSSIGPERAVSRGEDLIRQGSTPQESTILLDGFTSRYKVLEEGGRQITAIHVPGDFVDLHSFLMARMDHGVGALTDCRIAGVPHKKLRELTDSFPHLGRVLWLTTLVDGSIHREWVVAMGRRTSLQHIAHLFCELFLRLEVVQRTKDHSYELPLTQDEIADTVGLSTVHVNRVLQALRKLDLISWNAHVLTIRDWQGLVDLAEFDPTFLNLEGKPL